MDMGPSQGFYGNLMNNLKQKMPQMINAVGQQYGGPMSGAAALTGGIMKNRMGRNKQPGTMPSTGPNNPFQRVQFGATQPPMGMGGPSAIGAPSPMGAPMSSPMGGGMPSGGMGIMDPNRFSQGGLSPLWGNYGAQAAGMGGSPAGGGMEPNPQGQMIPGLNRPVMF